MLPPNLPAQLESPLHCNCRLEDVHGQINERRVGTIAPIVHVCQGSHPLGDQLVMETRTLDLLVRGVRRAAIAFKPSGWPIDDANSFNVKARALIKQLLLWNDQQHPIEDADASPIAMLPNCHIAVSSQFGSQFALPFGLVAVVGGTFAIGVTDRGPRAQ
jgi:hypothetical protein